MFQSLAQRKFYYSINYLKGLSLIQMAQEIEQFTNDLKTALKIVKKFLRSDIIDYYGQQGYKTKTGIIL